MIGNIVDGLEIESPQENPEINIPNPLIFRTIKPFNY